MALFNLVAFAMAIKYIPFFYSIQPEGGGLPTLGWGRVAAPSGRDEVSFRFLFMSEERLDQEINRWIGAPSAGPQTLYQAVVVNKELNWRVKLLL